MFILNEKVFYPGHGVAKINRIIDKRVDGSTLQFFELTFINKDMTILVPTSNLPSVGVRRLSSDNGVDGIFKMLSERAKPISTDPSGSNWNKRNKEYQRKLRSGSLQEICEIYRDLKQISSQKELSFGEKSLLQETESLLSQEIAIVKRVGEDVIVQELRAQFDASEVSHQFTA
ncbi:hypothetical protein HRU45_02770 [Candidatus Dependentiae bacterium]|nr:hypothetical protein [Candidatus Dependentiae bacterium]